MWVARTEYIALREQTAAQATSIEWLRQRVNQLEREKAVLQGRLLDTPPGDVPVIERATPVIHAAPLPGRPPAEDTRPSMEDLARGNISFEDMGDDAAKRAGVDWDNSTGMVRYGH